MTTYNKLNIFCDGACRGNPGPAAAAFIIYDQHHSLLHQQGLFLGVATNNQAEYHAVFESLKYLCTVHCVPCTINFYLDSELVVNQLTGLYKIKDEKLKIKYFEIKKLISSLQLSIINFNHISREKNTAADLLVNQTLDKSK
jgi:ribonuclease HI